VGGRLDALCRLGDGAPGLLATPGPHRQVTVMRKSP
jgi:hypothetical protein